MSGAAMSINQGRQQFYPKKKVLPLNFFAKPANLLMGGSWLHSRLNGLRAFGEPFKEKQATGREKDQESLRGSGEVEAGWEDEKRARNERKAQCRRFREKAALGYSNCENGQHVNFIVHEHVERK